MGNISHHPSSLSLLFIVIIIATSFTPNNAHSLPYTTQHPPSHAPAPSPSHHHHHHHRHRHRPALVPSPQPSKPVTPSPPPAKPPTQVGKRKFVAVQGMVYCNNNCSYDGVYTLLGASPLPGATVVLRCRNTQYLLRKTATTDSNGYFFLEAPPLVTTYGAHKCKVSLAQKSKPNTSGPCSNAIDLNSGASGAYLFSNNTGPPKLLPIFSLFSVGPFAYESTKCYKH